MKMIKYMADKGEGGAEDYLSKLANSILKKGNSSNSIIPPIQTHGTISRDMIKRNQSASQRETAPPQGRPAEQMMATPATPTPVQRQKTESSSSISRDWLRRVEYYDEAGRLLPGTILVFEDGHMGVYKETNQAKDYDIVYQLKDTGNAEPHGMPLYTYSVEPVGRLSTSCLEQIISTNRWERDMIVFHLMKFKDRVHIPQIHGTQAPESIPGTSNQGENFSSWAVRKLSANDLSTEQSDEQHTEQPASHNHSAPPAAPAEKPTLTRGRRMTIEFGPTQKWDAVYWGKDELGHVVAHNTHERWALMHLDLNRFKDCITFAEQVDADTIKQMEKDFTV